ncbi:MAG TPA: NAD(P)H-binding protein [Polyangiaceae bacterium]|nr:NAD(P)H-binding protein [Polyangiaceae bacterium]
MKLLILGATGHIGRELVDLALARGHIITAYVRNPSKIQRREPQLIVTQGDALEADRLTQALRNQDAVVSALGLPARQALRPSSFMAESMASVVAAMKRAEILRLAAVSAAVLFPMPGPFYAFFRWLLKHHARDLSAMESVIQATDLDWTIARPPRLVTGPEAAPRAVVAGLPDRARSISYRSVAAFLLDCVEHERHVRRVVGLSQ